MNEIDKEAKTTAVVEPISQILEEIEAKASMNSSLANSVVVIDMGNLLAFDPRPVDSHLMKKDVESYLLDHCTRTTQLIVNNLFKLPTENVDDILVAKLPKPSIVIPREKPLPKQKPLTKWEQYAKMKGIQKKKKGRKVYDEVAKEWRPMWGYNRAKETTKEWLIEIPKNQDPNQDFFAKKTQEKTERVAKNELQRLRNIARSSKKKVPGIGMTPTDKNPPDEKLRIKKSLHMAKTADASMSKFSQKLKDELLLCKMYKWILLLVFGLVGNSSGEYSDDHWHWLLGNAGDFVAPEGALNGGVLLDGGAYEENSTVDGAFRWFLTMAARGDVVVLKIANNESVPDDYDEPDYWNSVFYTHLWEMKTDSVETIFFNSRSIAYNKAVIEKIRRAEGLFFSGGDQAWYYDYITGSPMQEAIRYLIHEKKAVVGGSSAGCAIQAEFGFTAEKDTISTGEALTDPYDENLTIGRNLLTHPWLKNTITDTHYSERNRYGRHIAFMARILKDYQIGQVVRAIGVDETTAVAVTSKGYAFVFGEGAAYFMQQNRAVDGPEQCEPGKPLDWNRNKRAINVYRIAGTEFGTGFFDLLNWFRGNGGQWSYMYIDNGEFKTD